MTSSRQTRAALLATCALLGGAAVPALASHGADDGPAHHQPGATGATGSTGGTGATGASSVRAQQAAAAAQAAVDESTTVLRVKRKHAPHGRRELRRHGDEGRVAWDVLLLGDETGTRYRVRLDRDLEVLRVQGGEAPTGATGSTGATGATGPAGAHHPEPGDDDGQHPEPGDDGPRGGSGSGSGNGGGGTSGGGHGSGSGSSGSGSSGSGGGNSGPGGGGHGGH